MDFEKRVEKLHHIDESAYSILKQIYKFDSEIGFQVIPDSFENKVKDYFGRQDNSGNIIETPDKVVERIEKQRIIKITNKWSGESTLFNSLRADRPGIIGKDLEKEKKHVLRLITKSENGCDFCQPEKYTPKDVFGRIMGKYSITASNIAKYDVWSSLVIFKDHNPLKFNEEEFCDYLKTSSIWFEVVNNHSPQYKFPFFVWNCMPRAGASQIHGHSQILMSKEPYAGTEKLIKTYHNYQKEYGANYFDDLYYVHQSLGLSDKNEEIRFFANITPLKEKEVIILSENPSKDLKANKSIFKILRCFIDVMGVFSFNLSISYPPLNDEMEFPYITRIVDRGSLLKSAADMGGMELYGSSVVADDPYKIINILKEVF